MTYNYLLPFVGYGVDLFVLISGYFLINLRRKVLIRLAVVVLAFELFSFIAAKTFSMDVGGALTAKNIIDPLGSSHYWFITFYIALVLLSPLLNKTLATAEIPLLRRIIILLTAFNVVSCWLFGNRLDHGGYSLFNFIYLYCIGHYIHRDNLAAKLSKAKIMLIFAAAVAVNTIIAVYMIYRNPAADFESLAFSLAGKYSNPFTIACAAAALMMFLKSDFRSRFVNGLATGALGVYLLQDGTLGQYIYRYQREVAAGGDMLHYLWLCAALLAGFWSLSYILMKLIDILSGQVDRCVDLMAHKSHMSSSR